MWQWLSNAMHSADWGDLWSKAAGFIGALVSTRFLTGAWHSRLMMALGGAMVAEFLGPWVTAWLSLPRDAAAFLLGLFGMTMIARVWDYLQTAHLSDFVDRWLPQRKAPEPKDKDTKP